MKVLIVAVLCTASVAVAAKDSNPIRTFEGSMASARISCTQEVQISDLNAQLGKGGTPVYYSSCMADAEPKVEASYKAFVATHPSSKVKTDARAALVAWLAAANGAEDDQSPLWAKYDSSIAELDADEAGL